MADPPSRNAAEPGGRRAWQLFFLAAGGFATLAGALWTASLAGTALALGTAWHAHEMTFGYTGAVLAGFLLAGAGGTRVAILVALWLAGRIGMLVAPAIDAPALGALDLLFFPALMLLRHPPLWRGAKWPTVGFVPLLSLLTLANLVFHLGAAGVLAKGEVLGPRTALDLYALMIAVMAGRLVPGYTRAMLIPVRTPRDPIRERWSVALLLVAAAAHLGGAAMVAGAASLAAGLLQVVRLAGWRTRDVLSRALLLVLHLGFAWFALALVLRGSALLLGWPDEIDALHALTVGAIGMLTLGMMTRLARAHARRKLAAGALTAASYSFIFAGTLLRVFAPPPVGWQLAGIVWSLAFALFLLEHGGMLTRVRPAEPVETRGSHARTPR